MEIFTLKNIIIYIIVINIVGFLSMYIDKRKAQKHEWRIKEGTLFTIVLLGGGIGSIIGMYKFRHKTKKLAFTIGFPTILITQIVLIIYCLIAKPWNFIGF